MHIDRIDFTDEKICHECERPLRLGIAHIIKMDDQTEAAFGPACARKLAPTTDYPNFTKAAAYADEEIEAVDMPGKRRGVDRSEQRQKPETERLKAITYLRLRQEKMTDFPRVSYKALEPIYERYLNATMTADDYAHVGRLMAVVERRFPLLALNALQTTYAYHQLLRRSAEKIKTDEDRRYLNSLDDYLRMHLRLTPRQIDGANRWLEHLGQVRLRPCRYWQAAP